MAETIGLSQQLADVMSALATAGDEATAARAAVEFAADLFDAELAAVVWDGNLLATVGDGGAPDARALESVRPGQVDAGLEVPGIGRCLATAVGLDHPYGATLVVARSGGREFSRTESAVLRAVAQVTSLRLRALHHERTARNERERLARGREALHGVATRVAEGSAAADLYAAVANYVAQRVDADLVVVLRFDPDETATIVGGWGAREVEVPVGARLRLAGEGPAVSVWRTSAPARVTRFDGPLDSVAGALRRLGLTAGVASPIFVDDRLWGAAVAAAKCPETLPDGSEALVGSFTGLFAIVVANAHAREELQRVADEQAALRRVATLIARDAATDQLFAAVAEEVGCLLPGVEVALLGRYEGEYSVTYVGGWNRDGDTSFVGECRELGGRNVSTLVKETQRPARVDELEDDAQVTSLAQPWARSSAGAPIIADGALWGVMIVASREPGGLPPEIEHRLAGFTELVAASVGNAQARDAVRRFGEEQAALRRVATLVALSPAPSDAFGAVAEEVGRLLEADLAFVGQYEADEKVRAVAAWAATGEPVQPRPEPIPLSGTLAGVVLARGGQAARIDHYPDAHPAAQDFGIRAAVGAPIAVEGQLWGVLAVSWTGDRQVASDTEDRLANFAQLVASAIANAQSNSEVEKARAESERRAEEQTALRRVATLVAQGVAPEQIFDAVATETRHALSADWGAVWRLESDGTVTLMSSSTALLVPIAPGANERPAPGTSLANVINTGRPARIEDYRLHANPADEELVSHGFAGSCGAPIFVEGRLWGATTVAWSRGRLLPSGSVDHLVQFTDLVVTAIANANARAELLASRARVIATADETRRRIERDLHDGVQQRLVSLALRLRGTQAAVPPELDGIATELDGVVAGINGALEELREFATGIHPAILAAGGLGPAVRALARRSAVPVATRVRVAERLPEPVEVAAYFVVSEALANAAKHAGATRVEVDVAADDGALRVCVRDDGVGGASFSRGSGLVGLRDRVEVLGGRVALESGADGTELTVDLPLED